MLYRRIMRRDLLLTLSMSCFAAFLSGFSMCHSCPEPLPPCVEPVNLVKLCPSTEGCTIERQPEGVCAASPCAADHISQYSGDVTYMFPLMAFGDPASRPPDLRVGATRDSPRIHVSIDGEPGACSLERCELPASAETLTVTFEHEPGTDAYSTIVELRDIDCEEERMRHLCGL